MTNTYGGPVTEIGMKLPFGYRTFHPNDFHNIADAGLGTGVPVLIADHVAGSEEVGWQVGADGDEFYTRALLNSFTNLNRNEDMHARLWFTCLVAADTGIDWLLQVKGQAEGELNTDAAATPDGSIVFAAQTSGLTTTQSTGWAALGLAVTAGVGILSLDDWLKIVVTCADTGTAAATEVILQGLEFRYTQTLEGPDGVSQST